MDISPKNGVTFLKNELSEKTGVPSERMKLMAKTKGLWRGVLKDDFDLTTVDFSKVKPPVQILLMGSATKLTGPKTKTVFLEDLPPDEAAKISAEPSGLVNLGNTCYLNSVVQCLRAIPSFRTGLANYSGTNNNSNNAGQSHALAAPTSQVNKMFIFNLRDLYGDLSRTGNPVQPSRFVMGTKLAFPQFAQTGTRGEPMQQDAEEFYSGLLTIISSETQSKDAIQASFGKKVVGDKELNGASNMVDALFGIKMEETLTCDEFTDTNIKTGDAMETQNSSVSESVVTKYDLCRKLVCNIQGGGDASSDTNVTHIMEGIALSLNGKLEKRSEVLGRDAVWTKTQRMARLPPVLCVQFGRFYWKDTPDSQDHAGVKCKVMKPVAFQDILDVYEFCSPDIQKTLKIARDRFIADEEERIAKKLKGDEDAIKKTKENDEDAMDVSDVKPTGDDNDEEDLKAALALSMSNNSEPLNLPPVGPGLPENFQGKYELFAVVTHKGRDADGGHYMSWVKAESQGMRQNLSDADEDNDNWFVFDDDEVSPCRTEDVLKLKGGGDWHMSYLNFYRAKK